MRDWMVVVGVVLIVAVAFDAWRRVRRERYPKVKVKLVEPSGETSERDEQIAWLKELPNGGARVVDRRHLINATNEAEAAKREQDAAGDAPGGRGKAPVAPAPAADDVELVSGMSSADHGPEPGTLDWLDDTGDDAAAGRDAGRKGKGKDPGKGRGKSDGKADAARDQRPAPAPGRLPRDLDPEVFMLNVAARSREGFRGEDILHILLACDLRFGDMNFFHRHEFEAGRGAIQFSVANMMQPGVFDIDNMGDLTTPGLVFFLTLPGPEDMMKAFDYMLETAQAVARNLDGDVLDEARSVLSKQSIEHCRQQIRDLERRLLARAH
jgi:cell division protein ZipA